MAHYIDEMAHKVMEYQPIDGMYGSEKIGDYLVTPHGDRLYSLRRADSGIVMLVRADTPHQAAATAGRFLRKNVKDE